MSQAQTRGIDVEFFFAPDCSSCGTVRRRLQAAAKDAGIPVDWRDTNILDDLERAVALRLLRTPAVVIRGQTVFRVPPGSSEFVAALRAACPSVESG